MLLETFLAAGLALGTPILLAALGELLVERTGVLNIGVEGMMLAGAFAAALCASTTGSALWGCVAAAAVGAVLALLFALAAVRLAADQIIVGAAINLLALGATGALYRALLGATGAALVLPTLPAVGVPLLGEVPVLGPVLARQHALVLTGLVATPLLAYVLAHTGLGLRLRSLGDHPLAAASLGLPVRAYRTAALAVGGALAGLGGAALTLAATNTFVEGMTAGRGFIALAVVVFGRWSPWGALAGAAFFGLASALQFQFQAAALAIPYQAFLMLPYVLTLAVLLLSSGGARAPRALGARYERE
ncbi:MAG: ABC transporter permease [Thermodesulfobacteriota bacterium]